MLAKLNAIQEALAQGIPRVHIGNGHLDDSLENGILAIAEEAAEAGFQKTTAPGTTVFASVPVSEIPLRQRV